jgi:hypothetical protein
LDYKFNSSTVADKVTKLIDHAIGYSAKTNKSNKYYRGTAGTVSGTVADVYILGSVIPIPNVKIGSGVLHLTAGEEVYVNAINGRLENSVIEKRVIDYNLLYGEEVENFLNIDLFGSRGINPWWSLQSSLSPDNTHYKLYTEARRANLTSTPLVASTPITYIYTAPTDLDLSLFHDGNGSDESDYIYLSMYVSDATNFNILQLQFYDDSDTYQTTIGGASIISGWNGITVRKSDFINSGMTDWSHITSIDIIWEFNITDYGVYVTLAYLGMARFFKPILLSAIETRVNTVEEVVDNMTGVADQIVIDKTDGITVGFPTDFLTLYPKKASYGKINQSDWKIDTYKVVDIGDTGSLFAYTDTNKNINFSQNYYYNTADEARRIEAGKVTLYEQKNGEHTFYYAGSNSADSAITLSQGLKIDNSGSIYFGTKKIDITDTEPTSPSVDDIWFDIS